MLGEMNAGNSGQGDGARGEHALDGSNEVIPLKMFPDCRRPNELMQAGRGGRQESQGRPKAQEDREGDRDGERHRD